jgi:hypothetical protein
MNRDLPQEAQLLATTGRARQRLALRKCRVCEWESMVVEDEGADVECPWCHAPTESTVFAPIVAAQASDSSGKNPNAAALGRLGGLKGGRARAQVLTPRRRRMIARKAARARWRKKSR